MKVGQVGAARPGPLRGDRRLVVRRRFTCWSHIFRPNPGSSKRRQEEKVFWFFSSEKNKALLLSSEKRVTYPGLFPLVEGYGWGRLQQCETMKEWPSLTWKKQPPHGLVTRKKAINHDGTKPRRKARRHLLRGNFVPLCLRG
jgi:hypothetical protein